MSGRGYYRNEDGKEGRVRLKDRSMRGDIWRSLPYMDRESMCDEERFRANPENRRRDMALFWEHRKAERWLEEILRGRRVDEEVGGKRKVREVWRSFKVVGKDGKEKGGKGIGEVRVKGGGEMEVEGKKPMRLKREGTDFLPLACVGSENSEVTSSE